MNRRQFLASMASGSSSLMISQCSWAKSSSALLLSAYKNRTGQYGVAAFNPTASTPIWQLPLPARAHGIDCHPTQPIAAVFDRRPGQRVHLIDWQQGKHIATIKPAPNRHFGFVAKIIQIPMCLISRHT